MRSELPGFQLPLRCTSGPRGYNSRPPFSALVLCGVKDATGCCQLDHATIHFWETHLSRMEYWEEVRKREKRILSIQPFPSSEMSKDHFLPTVTLTSCPQVALLFSLEN